ncbi:hypothetical protein GT037_006590 [Alternaria burnsii]|uniref:Uncharacterized protein n=1 Tax=Alternaria burnsii TaxID=1187904 RepID=A0A8H7EFI4_9PLEO|nr:uncharacterized protein GT037_006590 [Alternaria burnsii]KAF7675871.1 hypothetical protein GT037_006590 [Alternaria burnsii]CAI9626548.1 unnamed protein product [Alternaria burnsii]
MAPNRRQRYTAFEFTRQESLDDTYQSDHQSDYESDSLNDAEQYETNKNELNTREPETRDAGLRAQDKSGKVVFIKKGAKAIEKQATAEINPPRFMDPGPEHVWKMKIEEQVAIKDSWEKIDEEDAPVPKTWLPKRFQEYPEDAESEIDPEMADNPAYLRQIIRSMAKQYARCRAELKEEEAFRIRAEWERNMAQRKAKRYWSYSIHVTETVALPIYNTQQIEDVKLRKRKKAVAKRERAVKLDRLAQQSEQADYEVAMEHLRNEVIETKKNLNALRDDVLENDAIKKCLRKDVMAELETDMMEERTRWQASQNQKRQELNREREEFDLERNASKEKKELATVQAVRSDLIDQGYERGLAVGKRFTAVEQYLRGYHFGERNANKKTSKQWLQQRYQEGMKAGQEEMSKKRDLEMEKFMEAFLKEVAHTRDDAIRRTEERLAEKFRVWMQERETAIRRNSRAYGLYEGTITQIRRQNNVEGSEHEEDALATIIATTMADQVVTASYTNQDQKTCWRNTINEESPLWMNSKVVEKSKFYEALHPKLTKEFQKATHRFELAKQEQEKQKQAHAARVENEWAARDATAQREEGEFVPVKSGAPAPYRHRLLFIVEEPLEADEAQEMSDKDMVATFLKNIRDQ